MNITFVVMKNKIHKKLLKNKTKQKEDFQSPALYREFTDKKRKKGVMYSFKILLNTY